MRQREAIGGCAESKVLEEAVGNVSLKVAGREREKGDLFSP